MAGSNNINADLYTRYRALIGRIDQAVSRGAPRVHKLHEAGATTPTAVAEPWRMASVSLADQVTRKLIETQADAMDEDDESDPEVDPTVDGMDDDSDMGETEPTDPVDPKPTDPTDPVDPKPTEPVDPKPTEPTDPMPTDPMPTDPEPTDPMATDPGPIDAPPTMPPAPVVDPTPVVDQTPDVDPTPVVEPTPVVDTTPDVPPPTLPVVPKEPVDENPPQPSAPGPVIPAAAATLNMLFKAQAVANDPMLQYKRALFRTLDNDNDGLVGTDEISNAIASVGGDKWSAAALNGVLDPTGSGGVTQQEFMDRLPTASFEYYDLMSSDPYYNPYTPGGAVGILEMGIDVTGKIERQAGAGVSPGRTETTLTPFDFNRNGNIDLHELMIAVEGGGGSRQSARALFNQLDPQGTGEITEQQFDQNLPIPRYDMTTEEYNYADSLVGQGIGALYFSMIWSQQPADRASRSLFYGIDADNDGMVNADDLSRVVAEAGGSTEDADALLAQLDPNTTGAISMEQFIDNLPKVTIGSNGVAAAVIETPAAAPEVTVSNSSTITVQLPQNLSNDMMSVLLAQQQTEEAWRGLI